MSGLVTQGRELRPNKPLQITGRAMVGALRALSLHLRTMPNTLQVLVTARPRWKTRAYCPSRKAAGAAQV
jgi:hypothetical protein